MTGIYKKLWILNLYENVKDLLAATSTGFLLTDIEPALVARMTNSSAAFKNKQTKTAQPEDMVWSG